MIGTENICFFLLVDSLVTDCISFINIIKNNFFIETIAIIDYKNKKYLFITKYNLWISEYTDMT